MAYFKRTGPMTFRATDLVGGAWDPADQHIAPAFGLLTHLVEADRDARRDDGLVIGRLSFEILGTIPVGEVTASVAVRRPGRTVELVEATLTHGGRDAVLLRAWLMRPGDTASLEGTPLLSIPPPSKVPEHAPSDEWPGGFIASIEVRRDLVEPGHGTFWARTPVALIDGEQVSALARAAGLFDIVNGMTTRVSPDTTLFPNVDLTAHVFRQPRGEWVGVDNTVSFGPDGIGMTSGVLHDEHGPVGRVTQILTVRPRR